MIRESNFIILLHAGQLEYKLNLQPFFNIPYIIKYIKIFITLKHFSQAINVQLGHFLGSFNVDKQIPHENVCFAFSKESLKFLNIFKIIRIKYLLICF